MAVGWLDRFRNWRNRGTAPDEATPEPQAEPAPAPEPVPVPHENPSEITAPVSESITPEPTIIEETQPTPLPVEPPAPVQTDPKPPPPPPPIYTPPPLPQAPAILAPPAPVFIPPPKPEAQEDPELTEAQTQVGILARFKAGLSRSREAMSSKVRGVIARYRSIDQALFDDLLDSLLEADVGFQTAETLVNRTKQLVKENGIREPSEVEAALQEAVREIVTRHQPQPLANPQILLVLGVNGVGKTTTIAKLANYYKQQDRKVLVAAADTFRAGAIHQLETWASRVGVDFQGSTEGQDPSAVVYQSLARFHKEGQDLLIVDTAGRLHTRAPLMEELKKMRRVALKQAQDIPIRTLLVLDAHTGQNALNQALAFKEACEVQELVLTKLDGTPKGGAVVAIAERLGLPVSWVGLGEKMTDLRPFDGEAFARALFENPGEAEDD